MCETFQSAEQTYISLGPGDENSNVAMEYAQSDDLCRYYMPELQKNYLPVIHSMSGSLIFSRYSLKLHNRLLYLTLVGAYFFVNGLHESGFNKKLP